MADTSEIYDLILLVDGTASMYSYLTSLQTSLPKIISISALTDSFARIGLICYRDYGDRSLLEWSGWMSHVKSGESEPQVDLLATAKNLHPEGGGDYPEATKTGLAKAYEVMREEATTLILLYTDAPPHTMANSSTGAFSNPRLEQESLGQADSFGGFGPQFRDWVQASRMMAMKEGRKRAQVFSILEPSMIRSDGNYYVFLSSLTGGACLYLNSSTPEDISKVTVDLLLAWMQVDKSGSEVANIAARIARFKHPAGIENVRKEATTVGKAADNTEELPIDSLVLKKSIPKRGIPVQDFAQRYKVDDSYKQVVVEHLSKIINEDVSAISLNPVFGSLWRAVCNDRENARREELTAAFGLQVNRIVDAAEKERMKSWLAESYDYTAEVQETIDSVPESERFPCVYLDPTLDFTKTGGSDGADEDEDNRPVTEFSRAELLEIGRSCDYRILRRLGRVLTRLTFVNNSDQLPSHIANAEKGKVIQIPLALASKDHGRRFWRILLHIIIPGTMLSARPAALLAALSIRLGIQPLFEAADTEVMMWRNKWNDLEVTEIWNSSCLSLILDANKAYLDRKREEGNVKGLLKDVDRDLFERLVSYGMLELNMRTTLTAKVGWTPEKTIMPIGDIVMCRSCLYPRSVTMMGAKGHCGNCLAKDYKSPDERQAWIESRVTKNDNEQSQATWVECGLRSCRAQYVVYNPHMLNVRPKCYYCRMQSEVSEEKRNMDPAPWLECHQCLSRVIFPKEYRTGDKSPYTCVACSNNRKSIVEVETNAHSLSKENTTAWLLQNKDEKLKDALNGRSLFHQITQAGTEDFCKKVILLPNPAKQKLTLNGKLILNTPDLISQLASWISGRRVESGVCSLCFSNFRKVDLNPACGRRGCEQRICQGCLGSWYGLNSAGRIINIAALSCPFCRRAPTARTLHNYGLGIHAVGDLQDAVANAGQWVYAWCTDCSRAKQYLERVCAAGAPQELEGWTCESCQQQRAEAAQREEDELAAELARLEAADRRGDYERRTAAREALDEARRVKPKQKPLDLRKCPNEKCEALTEKSNGCGHMKCICGTDWCWFCGVKKTASSIYDHMSDVHGGWFEGEIEGSYADLSD